jgi:hypothetical protein
LVGAFLTGVGFVVVELDAGAAFTGVAPVVFFSALAGLESGVEAVFLTAVGSGFLVAAGAAGAGFEAVLVGVLVAVTGVFADVEVAAGLLAEAVGNFFTVPRGVLAFTGVAFAGAGTLGSAGVDADAPAVPSFFGTFFTGVAAESEALVVEAAGFFTGVALVAVDAAVFVVELVVFFAVCPAP